MAVFHSLAEALAAERSTVRELVVDANRAGNAWASWPEELWTFENLEVLRINQGRLYEVPSQIRALTRLRVLEVRGALQRVAPAGIGELAQLRELSFATGRLQLPDDATKLTLDRLEIRARWDDSLEVIARIPVRINVTLIDGHPDAAEWIERRDLSAWQELQELEIDAFEDFEPTVFARKLPRCGFAINRIRRVDWQI